MTNQIVNLECLNCDYKGSAESMYTPLNTEKECPKCGCLTLKSELTVALVKLQATSYLGTKCANCRKEFKTVEQTRFSYWWGSKLYPLCCNKKCYDEVCPPSFMKEDGIRHSDTCIPYFECGG